MPRAVKDAAELIAGHFQFVLRVGMKGIAVFSLDPVFQARTAVPVGG